MELKYIFFALLAASFALATNAHAHDQTGFISIDCGLKNNLSTYDEKSTGISYISDDKYIYSGEKNLIAEKYREYKQQQLWSLRSFPQGSRNCYHIEVTQEVKYLIRASFFYGEYENEFGVLPEFDLHLGPNLWASVNISDPSKLINKEIIHVPHRNRVQVCLVKRTHGIPFISAIELRPLNNSAYNSQNKSLALSERIDIGSSKLEYRYGKGNEYDAHDRVWSPGGHPGWNSFNTSETVRANDLDDIYNIPSIVMSTAVSPKDPNAFLDIFWRPEAPYRYYFFMHFAEIEILGLNELREFNIFYNGDFFYGPLSPFYLRRTTIMNKDSLLGPIHNFTLSMTENSTHPPIMNAFEIFKVIELPQSESDPQDVDAVTKLKSTYGLMRNWQGDPCAPKEYSWEGLTCSYDGPPRVIFLNLSASELTGEIATSIANLSVIEKLDLSNNNLTGSVPDFLSKLPNLKFLNLENNQLSGSVPLELIEKSNKGFLSLSIDGNANLGAAYKKKKSAVLVIAISVAGIIVLLLLAVATWWVLRRKRKNDEAEAEAEAEAITFDYSLEEPRKKKFTYSDIIQITNNFERVIGRGGFGTVYHGLIGNTEVAVKVLSASTVEGYQQFQAEVNILMRVYHRNLTTLVGYFTDENRAGLVYEYMSNGDLQSHLRDNGSSTNNNILKWEDRLRIALDAGRGLEYLHQGCKPPIVHRDVKSTNILLNESFQAKLSDFGISKTFPTDSQVTSVSTAVAGTLGYLDPEYYMSGRLNEKSDVYSFGILLLEIITGRVAMSRSEKIPHLGEWVRLMVEKGLIKRIIDPRLQDLSLNSAWKVVDIAMNCVSSSSADRPTMGQVVGDLEVCLEMVQVAEANEIQLGESSNFIADEISVQPPVR